MTSRTLALKTKTATRHFRVDLVRTEALVGAHFYDEALSSESPVSFVVSSLDHDSFSKYACLEDNALFDICVKEFIEVASDFRAQA